MAEVAFDRRPVLSTGNAKLAATFLLFDVPLERRDPTFCAYEVDAAKPDAPKRRRVRFNFKPDAAVDVRAIAAAFAGVDAETRWEAALEGLPAPQAATVRAAHSAAVCQACRQVMEHREWLDRLLAAQPEASKWHQVVYPDGRRALVSANANAETKALFFTRHD